MVSGTFSAPPCIDTPDANGAWAAGHVAHSGLPAAVVSIIAVVAYRKFPAADMAKTARSATVAGWFTVLPSPSSSGALFQLAAAFISPPLSPREVSGQLRPWVLLAGSKFSHGGRA